MSTNFSVNRRRVVRISREMNVLEIAPEAVVTEPLSDRRAAIRELFDHHHGSLLRLAMMIGSCEQRAQDAVQEAFLKLYRSWPELRDPDKAPAWLRVTVVNHVRKHGARESRAGRLRLVASTEPPAEVGALLSENQREVIDALRRLPPRQREVLVLRYWSECSEREIASLLDVSAGSVKTHASRGLQRLRKELEGTR